MRIDITAARRTALATAIALLPAIAPAVAGAQGKGHKSGHDKEKREKVERTTDAQRDRSGAVYRYGSVDATQPPGKGGRVPPGQMPPSGMCRIWIDGVPPGRQPAPTDCNTAERNRPSNARVIYGNSAGGDVYRDRTRTRRRDYPSTSGIPTGNWPYLSDALAFSRGTRMSSVATLVPDARSVRLSDRSVNGVPTEALFYDGGGQLLEIWRDQNGDGRADRITKYRNGSVIGEWRP